MFAEIAETMVREKGHLCELDGHIGDADHGIAMELGFVAARDAVTKLDLVEASLTETLTVAGKAFLNAVGASSGPLYATAMLQAASALREVETLDDAARLGLFDSFAAGIARRGKANLGDKTMLDAWAPAAEAARGAIAAGRGFSEAVPEIVAAADAGADATRDMVAALGRASRLGERSLGHPDPGAVSAAYVVAAMGRSLSA
jgi:dihydroxyacetone kinase-like protein